MKKKIAELAPQMYSVLKELQESASMYSVLKELQESASYWSEYDVPIGIVDKINDVLEKVENAQKVDTIKTTFDLRTCFVNMQNNEGVVILDKTQWGEICKLLEN